MARTVVIIIPHVNKNIELLKQNLKMDVNRIKTLIFPLKAINVKKIHQEGEHVYTLKKTLRY